MAKRKSAEELRQEAAKMLQQAKQLEDMENIKIGEYIRSVANTGYKIGYEELKHGVASLLSKNSIPTNHQQVNSLKDKGIDTVDQKISNTTGGKQ